jgi:hypothetical protein
MLYFLGALSVYKIIHVTKALLPREVMPWVVVSAGTVVGVVLALLLNMDYPLLSGLALATLAGGTHSALRLLTLLGDMAHKKSL